VPLNSHIDKAIRNMLCILNLVVLSAVCCLISYGLHSVYMTVKQLSRTTYNIVFYLFCYLLWRKRNLVNRSILNITNHTNENTSHHLDLNWYREHNDSTVLWYDIWFIMYLSSWVHECRSFQPNLKHLLLSYTLRPFALYSVILISSYNNLKYDACK